METELTNEQRPADERQAALDGPSRWFGVRRRAPIFGTALILCSVTASLLELSYRQATALRPADPLVTTSGQAFYVAPDGRPTNDGSGERPWDLQTALNHPKAVKPGDTIWIRGGIYVGNFTSYLTGDRLAPIIVRHFPGEPATIDSTTPVNRLWQAGLRVDGSDTWYWGFEVMDSYPVRQNPSDALPKGGGVEDRGTRNKFINMIVHDTDGGFSTMSAVRDTEIYGNIIYHVGEEGADRGYGHSIYVQNQAGTKRLVDNILFNGFSFGIHGYTQQGYLNNLHIEGNIVFNHGILSKLTGFKVNILVGGERIAVSPTLLDNYAYFTTSGSGGRNVEVGYIAGCTNATIQGNYSAGGAPIVLSNCTDCTMTKNTFYGYIPESVPSEFPDNTYHTSPPTGVKIFVRPNRYELGRAHIAVFNWDTQDKVTVDLRDTGLTAGDEFEIRDAQNYFGAPVVSGTYTGRPISIPMTGLTLTPPIGNVPILPVHTAPTFGAFVLIKAHLQAPNLSRLEFLRQLAVSGLSAIDLP